MKLYDIAFFLKRATKSVPLNSDLAFKNACSVLNIQFLGHASERAWERRVGGNAKQAQWADENRAAHHKLQRFRLSQHWLLR